MRLRPAVSFLLAVLLAGAGGELRGQEKSPKHIIRIEMSRGILNKMTGLRVDPLMKRGEMLYLLAGPRDLLRLRERNIPYVLESAEVLPDFRVAADNEGGINGDFHDYRELERDIFLLADSHPELARVVDIGDSLEGRNIYALKISDNVWADEDEAAVVFLGCHHAREWISVEVPFLMGKHLLENYQGDGNIKGLVDNSEIWIVPLVNPDGLEYSIHFYRYWRKNRRDNGDGSFGVDLNRNYGFEWGHDDIGSSPDPSSETYRGRSAFSEPETQAVRNLLEGRNFQALVSFHSYSQVILYPWGYKEEASPEENLLYTLAENMSRLMEEVNGRYYEPARAGASFYLTNGDTTDWSFGVFGIPSFTVELPPASRLTGEFFNPESDILPIFQENLPAMLYLIDWAVAARQSLNRMTDRKSGRRPVPLRLR